MADLARAFLMIRDRDASGMSGTGPVADGVVFPDGTTVVRWRQTATSRTHAGVKPTTVIFPDVDAVIALHGHDGATRIEYLADRGVTPTEVDQAARHPRLCDSYALDCMTPGELVEVVLAALGVPVVHPDRLA